MTTIQITAMIKVLRRLFLINVLMETETRKATEAIVKEAQVKEGVITLKCKQ